ncbi:MAG: calcium-translocating P-type ATPase, SERCA-type [Anaerolineaceae bacterium]|nr:calcium-translocating P-type ATPase, SERCA-type [Anaerolineaceae bacterium]
MIEHIHALPIDDVAGQFETHLTHGLTSAEARARLLTHGYNELTEKPRPGFFKLLLEQFSDFLVRILIVAAILSLALGEVVDASAILAIVLLNAILGVVQESKAEQALVALKKMSAPNARVLRDGTEMTIPTRELVPGDVVILEAGNYIPADLRLFECMNLKVEEASLTGESVPVNKDARVVLDRDIPIGDRKNSAFMSTLVTYGRGRGLVTATGMHTQIGLIAKMIQSAEDETTPLQIKLAELGKMLGVVSLAICGIIFLYGIVRDTQPGMIFNQGIIHYLTVEKESIIGLFMTAVSLAIAAVPEGLPAVVTICLALGMQRMVARHALIRKLPVVETLGCATVICSDKTGTLTQNQMTVVQGWVNGSLFKVTGDGYNPEGTFSIEDRPFEPKENSAAQMLMLGMVLCNDSRLELSGQENGETTYRMIGDPTEGALVVMAAKSGFWAQDLLEKLPRVNELPFDSDRKRMTTIHQIHGDGFVTPLPLKSPYMAFVKGAPDVLLQYCDCVMEDGEIGPLTDAKRKQILDANQHMASQALRVLGLAYRPYLDIPEALTPENTEVGLTFIGLAGMIDPARPEVITAVRVAREAGLKTVMVTGDYKDTAEAIAREIGILSLGGQVLTGADLDRLSDEQFSMVVEKVDVYARVSPQHKMRIVDAFKARGHVASMTGDGVNDAPALKKASIGIAMGITGTDVSKETADMVLTDDNFASILAAIEEGRVIFSNIRKFVFYLISCNIGEILIIFLSMLLGMPIPLLPIHLLWLNLVTDGAPALALGLEKGDPDIMKRQPRPSKESIINRDMLVGIVVQAIVMTGAVLALFAIGLSRYPNNWEVARTMAFVTLTLSELLRAYTARSERFSIFSLGIWGNRWLQYAVGSSILLLLAVVYVPFIQPFFKTVPLSLNDWIVMAPFFLLASVAAELTKWYLRRSSPKPATQGVD